MGDKAFKFVCTAGVLFCMFAFVSSPFNVNLAIGMLGAALGSVLVLLLIFIWEKP